MMSEPFLQALQMFSKVDYFSELDEGTLREVVQMAVRRTIEAGEVVFWEGEPCVGMYIVEAGWLKVSKLAQTGREQVLHFISPGETFNALSVFTGTPNPATVVALEPCTVWLVYRERMLALLEAQPKMARQVIADLAGRVLHMMRLVEDISLRSVEARLARFLLEQEAHGAVKRRKWATQAEMAARLGTVPDVLNRALRKLGEEGLIEVTRQTIRLVDGEGLKRRAEGG
ncbi:MAG: Crp/Fnr family transcriptional regulator [Anaerolineales bacterium]|nr:Crp/Fnr family transcriptional regulator [Anaerolineales bacterium]